MGGRGLRRCTRQRSVLVLDRAVAAREIRRRCWDAGTLGRWDVGVGEGDGAGAGACGLQAGFVQAWAGGTRGRVGGEELGCFEVKVEVLPRFSQR